MKNTNRYKLVPVLVIGLVLSTFSATAEVKSIIHTSKKGAEALTVLEVKENEVMKVLYWKPTPPSMNNNEISAYISIILADGRRSDFHSSNINSFVCAGPFKIEIKTAAVRVGSLEYFWILTVDITPNEKH